MLKKITSILLIILLLSQIAFASEIEFEGDILAEETEPVFRTGGVSNEVTMLSEAPEDLIYLPNFFAEMSFGERLMSYIEAYIEETNTLPGGINVEGHGITMENIEEKYFAPALKNPHLLLAPSISYYDENEDGVLEAIRPKFLVKDAQEFKKEQQAMMDGMKEYVELAQEYDTPVEKLLAIHDKMVELCEYDIRVMDPDPAVVEQAPYSVYHALGVFRDKFAVCQGYSQAMYMLGKELGIEIELCHSEEAYHMWNYVKLGGKWYYMDMTNDDPRDEQGRAAHTFFLFSENKLHPQAHGTDYHLYGGGTSPVCNDTKYDSDHFFNLPILFKGYKDANGYYSASINYTSSRDGIDTTITFKSPSLYTGAVITTAFIADGYYTATENGQTVQKKGPNLYLLDFATRDIGESFSLTTKDNKFLRSYPARASMAKGKTYLRGLQSKVSPTMDLSRFSSLVLGAKSLEPFSLKTQWHK